MGFEYCGVWLMLVGCVVAVGVWVLLRFSVRVWLLLGLALRLRLWCDTVIITCGCVWVRVVVVGCWRLWCSSSLGFLL